MSKPIVPQVLNEQIAIIYYDSRGGSISKTEEVEIILAEYKCLRDEILQKMDSSWKILTLEAGGTSLILGYVFVNSQYVLLPIIPFLILVTSFLHMGETLAIMNAGYYIRENIQKDLQKLMNKRNEFNYKSFSWESFVEKNSSCYKLIHVSTSCLFIGLYWVSFALILLLKQNPEISMPYDWQVIWLFLLLYIIGFALFMFVWITRIIRPSFSEKEKTQPISKTKE